MFHQFFAEKKKEPVAEVKNIVPTSTQSKNISTDGRRLPIIPFFQKLYPSNMSSFVNQTFAGMATSLALMPAKYFFTQLHNTNFLPHPSYLTPQNVFRASILTPVKEEFIFRGMIQPATKAVMEQAGVPSKQAEVGSILTTATLFSIVHKRPTVGKFLGGVSYGVLSSIFDGSLWASTVAHATHNSSLMLASKTLKR